MPEAREWAAELVRLLRSHMGRPPKLTPAQKAEARRRRAQGATLAELARSYGKTGATNNVAKSHAENAVTISHQLRIVVLFIRRSTGEAKP
jgi:hypothetical protein